MTPSEPFNFGRKIKELKKLNKKGYADLTAGLKISRERIIALEEGEREPTDVERERFAAFYNLPIEEFLPRRSGVSEPSFNSGPRMSSGPVGGPPRPSGNYNPQPRPSGPPPRPANPLPPRPASPGAQQAPVREQPKPKPPQDPQSKDGEPKPVMKYTAEQLGDIESAYLRKQRDLKVPLTFTFLNGKEFTGVVVDFTPFTVHIIEDTGEEVILRKLAMAYYRKADALTERGGD